MPSIYISKHSINTCSKCAEAFTHRPPAPVELLLPKGQPDILHNAQDVFI